MYHVTFLKVSSKEGKTWCRRQGVKDYKERHRRHENTIKVKATDRGVGEAGISNN